jgi:hypothetical protein
MVKDASVCTLLKGIRLQMGHWRASLRHRSHLMNSVGDGRKRRTLKPGSPLQRVRRVSVEATSTFADGDGCNQAFPRIRCAGRSDVDRPPTWPRPPSRVSNKAWLGTVDPAPILQSNHQPALLTTPAQQNTLSASLLPRPKLFLPRPSLRRSE